MQSELDVTRPIIEIENRSAQEVFDIMVARIKGCTTPPEQPTEQVPVAWMYETADSKHVQKSRLSQQGRAYYGVCVSETPLYSHPPATDYGLVEQIATKLANADLDGPEPEEYWAYLAQAILPIIAQAQIAAAEAMQEACANVAEQAVDAEFCGTWNPAFVTDAISALDPAAIVKEAGHG